MAHPGKDGSSQKPGNRPRHHLPDSVPAQSCLCICFWAGCPVFISNAGCKHPGSSLAGHCARDIAPAQSQVQSSKKTQQTRPLQFRGDFLRRAPVDKMPPPGKGCGAALRGRSQQLCQDLHSKKQPMRASHWLHLTSNAERGFMGQRDGSLPVVWGLCKLRAQLCTSHLASPWLTGLFLFSETSSPFGPNHQGKAVTMNALASDLE